MKSLCGFFVFHVYFFYLLKALVFHASFCQLVRSCIFQANTPHVFFWYCVFHASFFQVVRSWVFHASFFSNVKAWVFHASFFQCAGAVASKLATWASGPSASALIGSVSWVLNKGLLHVLKQQIQTHRQTDIHTWIQGRCRGGAEALPRRCWGAVRENDVHFCLVFKVWKF